MLPEKAFAIAKATVEQLNLRAECKVYGANIKTTHCKLYDKANNAIFYGCGKGLGIQSIVSAYYEALEHHSIYAFCQEISQHRAHYFSLNDPMIYKELEQLDIIPKKMFKLAVEIPFILLSEVTTDKKLPYPIYLIDPRYAKKPSVHDKFDYQEIAWKASDSGTASGTSELEASIHALNEIIERDACSLFLIKTFIQKNNIRVINKLTLPAYLKNIVTEIETHYSEELIIVDMTSDIGVPSFFVSMTNQAHTIQPKGCGTSLNRDYALERALLESLQPLHIYNEQLRQNQKQILQNFAAFPLLAECAKADILARAKECEKVDFNSLPSYDAAATLEQQRNSLIERIKSQGFEIYTKQIAKAETGFNCMKYIVPGFEQFYLVQAGKYILPNKRGMTVLEKLVQQ